MENQLPQKNQTPTTSLTISDSTKAFARVLVSVNELLAYKLEGEEILRWSIDVDRLAPGTDPEALAFILDCFKTERLYWDRNKGIQNIFFGLKRITKTNNGYRIIETPY